MTPRVLPEAENEIQRAMRRYERQRRGLGEEFVDAVSEAMREIAVDRMRFSRVETLPSNSTIRRALLKRFPYLVVFKARETEIVVVAIATPATDRTTGNEDSNDSRRRRHPPAVAEAMKIPKRTKQPTARPWHTISLTKTGWVQAVVGAFHRSTVPLSRPCLGMGESCQAS